MTGPSARDMLIAKRQRTASIVIIGTFAIWVIVQALGAYLGLPVRWVALVDLVALAALAWALIIVVGVWRMRREKE